MSEEQICRSLKVIEGVLIKVLQRKDVGILCMNVCVYVCMFIQYYKKLACMTMEAGKSKICRVGDPGEPVFQFEHKASLL